MSLGGGEDILENMLVKDKFGNTLNLMDSSDCALHRLTDSDTTVNSSLRYNYEIFCACFSQSLLH